MNMNSRSLWVRYDGLFESDLMVCDIREQVQHERLDKRKPPLPIFFYNPALLRRGGGVILRLY